MKLKVSSVNGSVGGDEFGPGFRESQPGFNILVARSELKPAEIQDLGDIMPKLLEIKNKANIPLAFQIQIELGDGEIQPDDETVQSMKLLLGDISDGFQLKK